jgi:hypothetical protein
MSIRPIMAERGRHRGTVCVTFEINGLEISRLVATVPNGGVWQFHVRLVGEYLLDVRSRVTVTLGGLGLIGAVQTSGVYVGRSEAQIVGGLTGGRRSSRRGTTGPTTSFASSLWR